MDRTWTLKSEISVRIVALLFTTVLYVCAIELAGVEGGKEERPGAGSPLLALVRDTAVVMLKHVCRRRTLGDYHQLKAPHCPRHSLPRDVRRAIHTAWDLGVSAPKGAARPEATASVP